MTARLLVDAEQLASQWLLAHPDVEDVVNDRVWTEIRHTPTYPFGLVYRIGGIPQIPQHLDRARLQVEAWADGKYLARLIAATLQAALHELEGRSVALGVVTAVDDDLGLTWAKDQATKKARYLFGVQLSIHPPPG